MRPSCALVVLFLLLWTSTSVLAAEGRPAVDLKDVLSVWQARTKQSQTVCYKWTESVNTFNLPQDSIYAPAFVQRSAFKKLPITHKHACSFQLDRGSVWHRSSGMVWNVNCLRFLRTCRWAYYQEPTMIFCSSTPEETEILPECAPAVAFIDECAYYDHEAKFQAGPILLLHHRATDKALGIVRHGDPKIVPGEETVDGHPCVQIKCGKYSYWTDLKNECLIRRYEWHRDEDPQPIFRVDLSYAENPQFGWVLTKWTVQYSFGNNNKGTSTSVVTAVEINGNSEPKEKLTVLPVGTVVNDERGGGRLRYVVLPDQSRREITREDTIWSATHAELLHSDPGKAIPRQFVELSQQMQPIGRASPADRDRSLAVLKSYLINRGLLQRDVDLTRLVAHRLFDSKEPDSAVRMCREFAQISDVLNRAIAPLTQELERELPFRQLLVVCQH